MLAGNLVYYFAGREVLILLPPLSIFFHKAFFFLGTCTTGLLSTRQELLCDAGRVWQDEQYRCANPNANLLYVKREE